MTDLDPRPEPSSTEPTGARRPDSPAEPDWTPTAEDVEPCVDSQEEIRALREELEAKERELAASRDRYLRVAAELDNARKRAARDREEFVRSANEALIRGLLPVLDNFERALQAARAEPGAAAVVQGVELIQRELLRALEKFGVMPFQSAGQPFDPERHEAVARVAADGHPEMTVVAEIARGYLMHGRVLRPAMVTVAMPPEPSPGDEAAA